MRRAHVFQRSAPRVARGGYYEEPNRVTAARILCSQIGTMLDRAEQAGLLDVAAFLDRARLAAEKERDVPEVQFTGRPGRGAAP